MCSSGIDMTRDIQERLSMFGADVYVKRVALTMNQISTYNPPPNPAKILAGKYDKEKFYEMAKGMEHLKEGGARCMKCYELRLEEAAQQAAEGRFDYFTTTLSISPLKNSQKLNEIGVRVGKKYGVEYLVSDFKKRNGYKRSVELSEEYGLYRQDYCGCEFSMREREHREKQFL